MYRDGAVVSTTASTGAPSAGTGVLQIGASEFGEHFNGLVDEVRIYIKVLTDAEIEALYQQESVEAPQRVATPVFTPNGGAHTGSVSVTLQTTTPGATIYYTTDGSVPSQSSNLYTGPMSLGSSAMVKAKAYKSGYSASAEVAASFTITSPFAFSLANGGDKSVVAGSSVMNSINAFLSSGIGQTVSFNVAGLPAGASASFSSATCSPACSTILTISTTGVTPAGTFPITVTSSGGGVTRTTAFTLSVSLALTVATPTISPDGGNFSSSVSVAIQTTTSGAAIRYTIDGSSPSESSVLYTGPINLTGTATVKAQAFKADANPSSVQSASFVKSVSSGTTYYVGKNGSDSNSCAQARNSNTPKLSVNAGIGCLASGDRLEIKAGTYTDVLPQSAIPAGRSWAAATTIARFGSDRVVLTGGGRSPGHYHSNQSYIVWDGIIFDVATNFVIANGAHHIRLVNFEIKNSADNGVLVGGGSDYNEFINGSVHDTGSNPSGPPHAFYVGSANNLFERLNIYNSQNGCGLHLYDGGKPNVHDNIIRYNRIWNNRGANCAGILVSNGSNNLIHNNVVWNNGGHGIYLYHGASFARVFNNTVYDNTAIGLYVSATDIVSSVWKNNISFGNKAGNILNSGTATIISNNLTSDPKFVDPAGHDFRIQSGSAAIDTGANLAPVVFEDISGRARPSGSAYDIGAYEY
jgi:parallel beta-helix repeat protein